MPGIFDDIDGYGTTESAQSIGIYFGGLHRAYVLVVSASLKQGSSSDYIIFSGKKYSFFVPVKDF